MSCKFVSYGFFICLRFLIKSMARRPSSFSFYGSKETLVSFKILRIARRSTNLLEEFYNV